MLHEPGKRRRDGGVRNDDRHAVAPAASGQPGLAAVEPGTYDAAVPTVRQIEMDAISGGDADPEIFDRQGFEGWWRYYELSLSGVN